MVGESKCVANHPFLGQIPFLCRIPYFVKDLDISSWKLVNFQGIIGRKALDKSLDQRKGYRGVRQFILWSNSLSATLSTPNLDLYINFLVSIGALSHWEFILLELSSSFAQSGTYSINSETKKNCAGSWFSKNCYFSFWVDEYKDNARIKCFEEKKMELKVWCRNCAERQHFTKWILVTLDGYSQLSQLAYSSFLYVPVWKTISELLDVSFSTGIFFLSQINLPFQTREDQETGTYFGFPPDRRFFIGLVSSKTDSRTS